jgi:hypothetical protein
VTLLFLLAYLLGFSALYKRLVMQAKVACRQLLSARLQGLQSNSNGWLRAPP